MGKDSIPVALEKDPAGQGEQADEPAYGKEKKPRQDLVSPYYAIAARALVCSLDALAVYSWNQINDFFAIT